jgi:hypothetical protein
MTGKLIVEKDLDLGVPLVDTNRLFGSFVQANLGLRGVFRETWFSERNKFNGVLTEMYGDPGFLSSFAEGEDPRVFWHNSQVWCLYFRWNPSRQDGTHFLKNLVTGEDIPVTVPLNHQGKNWTPVSLNGRLLVIHSLVPFLSFFVDTSSGEVTVNTLPSVLHSGFTEWRGGTPGRPDGDHIIGVGHRTINPNRHQPFWWRIHPISGAAEFIPLDDEELQSDGMFVNDPTSLLDTNRIVVCSTPHAWTEPQRVRHTVCRIVFGDPK